MLDLKILNFKKDKLYLNHSSNQLSGKRLILRARAFLDRNHQPRVSVLTSCVSCSHLWRRAAEVEVPDRDARQVLPKTWAETSPGQRPGSPNLCQLFHQPTQSFWSRVKRFAPKMEIESSSITQLLDH